MPFTAFHMGPGLAIKAVAGRRFSLLAFGVAQVVMDMEPLIGMVRGAAVLHGPTHTYLAALVLAVLVAAICPWASRALLQRFHRELRFYRLDWLVEEPTWQGHAVLSGALLGTLSHVLLDSFMHADITPLAPWSDSNVLLAGVSVDTLHGLCVLSGALGALGWVARGWLSRGKAR